jgi:hypothetical protein
MENGGWLLVGFRWVFDEIKFRDWKVFAGKRR